MTRKDLIEVLKHEYGHFNDSGVGDYEVLLSAIEEIERLNAEVEEWRLAASVVRSTIGHCFKPDDYTQTCSRCISAVKFIDDRKRK